MRGRRPVSHRSLQALFVVTALFCLSRSTRGGINEWTSIGPNGARIGSVAIAPSNPNIIYAGTIGTLKGIGLKSLDGGVTWAPLSIPFDPNLYSPAVRVAVSPLDENLVFAGSEAELLKSSDGGATWARPTRIVFGISAIAFQPGSSTVLWAAFSNGTLQKSIDGGSTWRFTASFGSPEGMSISIDPSNVDNVYVAVGRVYRTRDGGVSWSLIDDSLPSGPAARALTFDPTDSTVLYLSRNDGIFRSADSGAHWTGPATGTDFISCLTAVVDPSDPSTVYCGTEELGLLKSTNSGAAFSPNGALCSSTVLFLSIDGADDTHLIAAGAGGFFSSSDSGTNWESGDLGVALADVMSLARDSSNSSRFFAATLGAGVMASTDAGLDWNSVCDPAENSNIFAMAESPSSPQTLYVGSGNGIEKTTNGGAVWAAAGLAGESIRSLAVDPSDADQVYAINANGEFFRTSDGGANWESALDGLPLGAPGASVFTLPGSPSIVLVANGGVFRSTDFGAHFLPTSLSWIDRGTFAADPQNPSVVYVSGLGFYRSSDGGANWTTIPEGPYFADCVAIDPSSSDVIYSTAGSLTHKTIDGGLTWKSWGVPVEGPSEISTIIPDLASPSRLYGSFHDGSVGVFDQVAPIIDSVDPTTGNTVGGTLLTIHGSGFMPESEVMFDGAPLTTIAVTGSSITVLTPPHPLGAIDIQILNPTFLSATLVSAFEYVCEAPFTAIVHGTASICPGSSATLQVFLSGVPPWTVHWADGPSVETSDSVISRFVSPTAPTTYAVDSVTDSSGCGPGTPSGVATITLKTPPPAPTITAPLTIAADASNVVATASVEPGNDVQWEVGNALSNSNSSSREITFTPLGPGATVRLSVTQWDFAGTGCFSARATRLVQTDFLDVPPGAPFHDDIANIAEHGVTMGCGGGYFCPGSPLSRTQMAALITRALVGSAAPIVGEVHDSPYACVPNGVSYFDDIDPGNPFCSSVHYLAANEITFGCGLSDFCPANRVTRGQMALFLGRAIAPGATPPSSYSDGATGRSYDCTAASPFSDVAAGTSTCNAVGYLWARGVVDGFGDGTYKPQVVLTRAPMAKFIARAFGMELGS